MGLFVKVYCIILCVSSETLPQSSEDEPVVEISSLRQLETHGCEMAQALLETPEVQQGFDVVRSMRRLSALYDIPSPEVYFQRKADVEYESRLSGDVARQSLSAVQQLCFVYYPLAEFKANIGHRLACLEGVNTDLPETEVLAKEMVDRVIWRTVVLDFSDVPEAAAKLSATIAANLSHIDDKSRERFRRNIELTDGEYIVGAVPSYSNEPASHGRRSESIQAIREVAQRMSYSDFTRYIVEMGVREQVSVLVWLGYFQGYSNVKSTLKGLGVSAEAYRVGLASVAKKLSTECDTKKEPPETPVNMTELADRITNRGLISIDGRLVRLGSSFERVIFRLQETRAYPDNLTPIELEAVRLLDTSLHAGKPLSLQDIADRLGFNVKSVQKIVRRIAVKFR